MAERQDLKTSKKPVWKYKRNPPLVVTTLKGSSLRQADSLLRRAFAVLILNGALVISVLLLFCLVSRPAPSGAGAGTGGRGV